MKLIPLSQGKFAKVDDQDYGRLIPLKWYAQRTIRGTWYAKHSRRDGKGGFIHILMHRYLMGLDKGHPFVDHVNLDSLDNRRINLRVANGSENMANRRAPANNISGFKGVCWDSTEQKWRVSIMKNGIARRLGYFTSKIEAANAYDDAAIEVFGEYSHLNFPFIYG
jgi:hypothetical protein